MSTAASIPDTQLGFTQSELVILRQSTEIAANQSRGGSNMADRGRGTSRQSVASSRAASAASSHSMQGRISLDSNSLGRLENALTALMRTISDRIQDLEDQAAESQRASAGAARRSEEAAEAEKKRAEKIMTKLDALDERLEATKNVCRKIRAFRKSCDEAGGRLNAVQPPPRGRGPIPIRG